MRPLLGALALTLALPALAQPEDCSLDGLPPVDPVPCERPLPPGDLGAPGEPAAPYSCGAARVFTLDFPLTLPAPALDRPGDAQAGDSLAEALLALPPLRRLVTTVQIIWLRWQAARQGAPITSKQAAERIGLLSPPAGPARFEAALAARLLADLQRAAGPDLPAWLCPAGPCGEACRAAAGALRVDVQPLLSERPGAGRRADGHRRFWRLRLAAEGDRADPFFEVQPAHQCAFMALLRPAAEAVAAEFGVPVDRVAQLKVGRQACVVAPMSVPATWAAEASRLGAPLALNLPFGERPVVAIVDTGLDFARHPDAFFTDLLALDPEPAALGLNPHASAMADFVRAFVAEDSARLWSFRVLDAGGTGPVGAVARALDEALFSDDRPLILNLSLAWLPEYERRRRVAADCQATEDAVGEPVRYLLAVAGEEDRRDRPVLVISAAGNRPLDNERPATFRVDEAAPYGPCTDGWWQSERSPQLMPAEWTRTWIAARCGGRPPPHLAVGAVDRAGRRAALAVADPLAEPPLVAPGEHVTDATGAVWSGSSVAAAFTSGAAARLWAQLAARGLRLTGAETADLLYRSAYALGRATLDAAPVRHLSADALDQIAACDALEQSLDCLRGGQAPAEECWAPCLPDSGPPDLNLPVGDPRPRTACVAPWDPSLGGADACSLANDWRECDTLAGQPVPGLPLSFDQAPPGAPPDRGRASDLGRVGPQPIEPPCSVCLAWDFGASVNLDLKFSAAFPVGTRFTDPYLLVYQGTDKHYIPILDPAATLGYKPGQAAYLSGISLPLKVQGFDQALLVVTVEQHGKHAGVATSPLYVKPVP